MPGLVDWIAYTALVLGIAIAICISLWLVIATIMVLFVDSAIIFTGLLLYIFVYAIYCFVTEDFDPELTYMIIIATVIFGILSPAIVKKIDERQEAKEAMKVRITDCVGCHFPVEQVDVEPIPILEEPSSPAGEKSTEEVKPAPAEAGMKLRKIPTKPNLNNYFHHKMKKLKIEETRKP